MSQTSKILMINSPFYRVYDSIKVQLLSCTWEATHTKVGKKQFACIVGKKSDPTKTRLPSFSKPQSVVLFFLSLFIYLFFLKSICSFIIFGVVHNSSFYLQNQSNFPFISGKCGNISNLLLSQWNLMESFDKIISHTRTL